MTWSSITSLPGFTLHAEVQQSSGSGVQNVDYHVASDGAIVISGLNSGSGAYDPYHRGARFYFTFTGDTDNSLPALRMKAPTCRINATDCTVDAVAVDCSSDCSIDTSAWTDICPQLRFFAAEAPGGNDSGPGYDIDSLALTIYVQADLAPAGVLIKDTAYRIAPGVPATAGQPYIPASSDCSQQTLPKPPVIGGSGSPAPPNNSGIGGTTPDNAPACDWLWVQPSGAGTGTGTPGRWVARNRPCKGQPPPPKT